MPRFIFRADRELAAAIRDFAAGREVTISDALRVLVEVGLDREEDVVAAVESAAYRNGFARGVADAQRRFHAAADAPESTAAGDDDA